MSEQSKCPHCGRIIQSQEYDPSDAIQKSGFYDQEWNDAKFIENKRLKRIGGFRKNPFPEGSDEYYRYNRGARFQMGM